MDSGIGLGFTPAIGMLHGPVPFDGGGFDVVKRGHHVGDERGQGLGK